MSQAFLANSNVIKFAKSRLDYLALNRDLNIPQEELRELEIKAAVAIVKCIKSVANFTCETAKQLGTLVKESPDISSDSKQCLQRELNARTDMMDEFKAAANSEPDGNTGPVGHSAPADGHTAHSAKADGHTAPPRQMATVAPTWNGTQQVVESWRVMLIESPWKLILDVDVEYECLVKYCAAFAKALGLNNPSERTVQGLIATVVAARSNITRQDLHWEDRLGLLRSFKEALKAMQFRCEGPRNYSTPEDLQRDYPSVYLSAYGQEPPVPPKVSLDDVQVEIVRTPCRISFRGPSASTPAPCRTRAPAINWAKVPRKSFPALLWGHPGRAAAADGT